VTCKAAIARDEWTIGLQPLIRLGRKKVLADAVLSARRGFLHVNIANVSVRLPATGIWSGQVLVAAKTIIAAAAAPPAGDPIEIIARAGRLQIGSLTAPCVVETDGSDGVALDTAGLDGPVHKANRAIVKKAAKLLEPLGVTEADVERLVDSRGKFGARPTQTEDLF